jgi:hypothetical protein
LSVILQEFKEYEALEHNIVKDGEYDLDAIVSKVNAIIPEGECRETALETVHFCIGEVKPLITGFQTYAGFTNEECDLQFLAMPVCTELQMQSVS